MTKSKSEFNQTLSCIESIRSRQKKKNQQSINRSIKKVHSYSASKELISRIISNQPRVLVKQNFNYENSQLFKLKDERDRVEQVLMTPAKTQSNDVALITSKIKLEPITPKINENQRVKLSNDFFDLDFLNDFFFNFN